MFDVAKRFLVGRKLGSDRLGETLLPKSLALPVFCSDPLSSVAYATQEILLVLSLGGLALLTMAWWVALAVVALLVIVVASYRQTCYAYPNGGGAYAVSRANLGSRAALVAASALLVDYVLTVAVSVAAGVDNIVSAFPVLAGSKVLINVGLIALLALINLRGVKESGTAFAIPTYGFVAIVLVLLGAGGLHMLTGHRVVAESAHYPIAAGGGGLVIALALRAFASGGTSLGFYLLQAFTAAIRVLAANTAFNGFPILASILGQDGYLPRQFARRGDRLVFSNGIVLLALLAAGLIWAFGASTTRLIQLYIIGVFVSFTLSQAGMVRHWNRPLAASRDPAERRRIHRGRAINLVGALVTALVLVIVLVTKFTHGAWLVVLAMPALYLMMTAIHRHYRHVAEELAPDPTGAVLPARIHAVVLVSRLHKPALRALAYARATRPDTLTALTVATTEEELRDLQTQWEERGIPVPLTVLESKYPDITGPVLDFIAERRGMGPRDVVVVYLPEYVVGHWWEHLLHNQSALRLKARLLFQPGVMVTSVPWQLRSSAPPPAPAPAPAEAPVPTRVGAV